MIFAQFYQNSTGYIPGSIPPRFDSAYVAPIEATGDRSVLIIDARFSHETIGRIAAEECKKRGYIGWRIFKGNNFSTARPLSGYWSVAGTESHPRANSASYGE